MKTFKINLSSVMPKNSKINLQLASFKKGPYKPEYVFIYKNENNRTYYDFKNTRNLNIAGKKINDVQSYSTLDYTDASTQNGRLYDILTNNINISLHTKDDKFSSLSKNYKSTKEIQIGNQSLVGDVTETVYSDGSKVYNIITPSQNTKTIIVDKNGKIVNPETNNKKSLKEIIGSKIKKALNIFKN